MNSGGSKNERNSMMATTNIVRWYAKCATNNRNNNKSSTKNSLVKSTTGENICTASCCKAADNTAHGCSACIAAVCDDNETATMVVAVACIIDA